MEHLLYELPKTNAAVFKNEKSFERSKEILASLGDPQNSHPAIHVAGTSGKGSVCYLIDAILRAHGKKTSLLVSPHVYDIRERIQINGQLISEKKFHAYANEILQRLQPFHATWFETLTSLGFYAAAREDVDYMIVETGFGGLWDTTNAITRNDKFSVISQIGYDHTAILGNTIEAISLQKAGIIQTKTNAVAIEQTAEVMDALSDYASKKQANLTWAHRGDDYQATNDNLAKATVQKIAQRDSWNFDEAVANETISRIFIPGRFEKRTLNNHLVVLDGAHNPQKLNALAGRLEFENIAPATIIFSVGERKDWQRCIEQLKPIAKRIIATEFFTTESDMPHHALASEEIVEYCNRLGIEAVAKPKPQAAIREALRHSDTIVITGSFYLLGEVDSLF